MAYEECLPSETQKSMSNEKNRRGQRASMPKRKALTLRNPISWKERLASLRNLVAAALKQLVRKVGKLRLEKRHWIQGMQGGWKRLLSSEPRDRTGTIGAECVRPELSPVTLI